MNRLTERNSQIDGAIKARKKEVDRERVSYGYVKAHEYVLVSLRQKIAEVLSPTLGETQVHLEMIDREKLSADIAIRLPDLLKQHGAAEYIKTVVPGVVSVLTTLEGQLGIESVSQKGIYVNVLLSDTFLLKSLDHVHTLAERFGEVDTYRAEAAVCEFSGPNAAKHLHAGHIRGTIVGESLSRLYAAAGYTVHRTNHINDWGGFGSVLEGYDRWKDSLHESENKNDELYEVYLKYRELEHEGGEAYAEFKKAADEQFAKLEAGDDATVAQWEQMVAWSEADFNTFYTLFGVHFDYSPGESFYVYRGKELVHEHDGGAVFKMAPEDVEKISKEISSEVTPEERIRLVEEITGKVGAWVVNLGGGKLFVVQRADGGSMYATRDLATLEYRVETFDPALITYVVGHEQTEYLRDMFRSAALMGLYNPNKREVNHAPVGLYVSKETGKKLSSREGALGVMELLTRATEHFKEKYASREYATIGMKQADIDANAQKLAIGSVIFNDLRKEHTLPVELSSDLDEILKEFEESGGAYIMYALARARAILRKAPEGVNENAPASLEPIERTLIKRLHELPEYILKAVETHNAAVIGNYVLEVARLYNSYYASYKVLDGETVAHPHRLHITSATAQVIENCLTLLNMHAPEVL